LLSDSYLVVQDQRDSNDAAQKSTTLATQGLTTFLRASIQYKISKTKLSISMMAVTPATESTKASLASC
jgi:hypothetical protein